MERKHVVDYGRNERKETIPNPGPDEKSLRVLRIVDDFSMDVIAKSEGILYSHNENWITALRAIRSHDDPAVYLKPFFLLTADQLALSEEEKSLIDGVVYQTSMSVNDTSYRKKMAVIHNTCQKINTAISHNCQYQLSLKVIRYMLTRKKELIPCMTSNPRIGYNYPVVDMLTTGPHIQQYSIVEFLQKKNLIEGTYHDTVHQCNNCSSAYLNFREICVNCHSPNIETMQIIHHFVCGNIGPEKDYAKVDCMVCPKCKRKLRQLGVDYDRPAIVYWCNECKHEFQEPDVDVVCFDCKKKTTPEVLVNRTIKRYSLTPLGKYCGINNILYSLQDELGDEIELIDKSRFITLAQKENERIRRYRKSVTSLGLVLFENINEIIPHLGSRSSGITRQLIDELKNIIRACDLVSIFSDACIVFLLVETRERDAQRVLRRLSDNMSKLASANINWNLQMKCRVKQMDGKGDVESVISELVVGRNNYACDI
ncbi:MAG: hypothetical protein ACLFSB_09060 [Chitinispirillaceae bacterium]